MGEKKEKIIEEFIFEFVKKENFINTKNEENLKILFQQQINDLARKLEITDKYLDFQNETPLNEGRTDFQYGNTIIEYKKYNKLSIEKELKKAREQIHKYLQSEKYKNTVMYGFIFDGVTLEYYEKNLNNIVKKVGDSELDVNNTRNLIDKLLYTGKSILSPINIESDFAVLELGGTKVKHSSSLELVREIYTLLTLKNNKKTDLLYLEWEKLFKLSEKDKGKSLDIEKRIKIFSELIGLEIKKEDEYKVLFSLHTSLNIIIKLLLVKATNYMGEFFLNIEKISKYYSDNDFNIIKNFMQKIESGDYFKQVNIINFVDGDFFSWYLAENWNTKFLKTIQKIMMIVDSYDFNKTEIKDTMLGDLFKGLYENFIPKAVRHSFGEYHTPSYLVKFVLNSLNLNKEDFLNKTFIDPCCGSGTFILEIYNKKLKSSNKKLEFSEFLNGVVGVDINPISTLITKANIFINSINKVKFDITKKYEIPIYNCDSLYIPQKKVINGVDCYYYSLYTSSLQIENKNNIELILPVDLVEREDFFYILERLEEHIIDLKLKSIISELESFSPSIKKIKKEIHDIFSQLIELEKKKLNSIWLKIFSNYFRLANYKSFDYIIGNPAWVRWGDLPELYRENLKNNIEIKNIFSSDKNHGGIDLNFCALLTNKSCERWFTSESKLAYLMPKSIIYNKSFEGFRKLIINDNEQLFFNKIYDFSSCGEIFQGTGNLEFSLFIVSKKNNNKFIPFYIMNKNNNNFSVKKEKKIFSLKNIIPENNFLELESEKEIDNLIKYIGKNDYRFRKGVEAKYPMRLFFIKKVDSKNSLFHPIIKNRKLYKIDFSRVLELENKYVFPFVTSPDLKNKWENLYVIGLYNNSKNVLDINEIINEAPKTYKWIMSNQKILKKGSDYNNRIQNKPFWGLLRVGDYSFKDLFVCIRDNSSLSPKIIKPFLTHWGEVKRPFFDGHISYISYSKDINNSLTEQEAQYIFDILNNENVKKIVLNSQSNRSISSNLPVKIPFFNLHDKLK
ncbi:hypothetical protein [Mycoplasma leonicaptivi]|uniref:hypothetical protein n=1 Tax=Mycoplasma leonicaptivi TaxID=36742 RepID=UPI00055B48B8|nr:hypothetical protein [Mycoplasma leonicaptivi]